MEAQVRGCHKHFRLISPINNSNNFVAEVLASGGEYNDGNGTATPETDKALKITNPSDSGRRIGYLVEGILNFSGGNQNADILCDMTRTKVAPIDEPDGEIVFRATDLVELNGVAMGGDYRGGDADWGFVTLSDSSGDTKATTTDNVGGGGIHSRDDRTNAFQDFVYLNPGEKIFYRLIGKRRGGSSGTKVRPGSKIEVTVISHTEP